MGYIENNVVRNLLRFAKFRGSKLPCHNPSMILKSYILYSFSLDEFSLMVSHKRFLMRQYKYKCSDMPFCFLLIFFPLGFRGVFSGMSYCTHFHSFFALWVYSQVSHIRCQMRQYLFITICHTFLFSPSRFLKEVYKAYILISKLTNEIYPIKVFLTWVVNETIIIVCCIIFSLFFPQV